jgi:predicted RNase H-like HicB family nuclease
MAQYGYTTVFEPSPEGGYNVLVPAIPKICTYGKTLEEARQMAQDARATPRGLRLLPCPGAAR